MAEDIKRNADIMRATAQCLEILSPFTSEERIKIVSGLVMFGGVRNHVLVGADIDALMANVKPRAPG